MSKRMSRWGVGPLFGLLSALVAAPVLTIDWLKRPAFAIRAMPDGLRIGLGIALLVLGVTFYVFSIVSVMRAYSEDRLITSGAFRFCRHPVYAAWAVFGVPGMVLLWNSWLAFLVPVAMIALIHILARKEERHLCERYGDAYREYQKRVPTVIPLGFLVPKEDDAADKPS